MKNSANKQSIAIIAACLLAVVVTPRSTIAQTPQQFLKPHVDWLKNHTQGTGDYSLNVVIAANQTPIANSIQIAKYGIATLRLLNLPATILGGKVTIYYSNKQTSSHNPFDQNQTVNQTISISPLTGEVTIGNDSIVAPQCLAGLMFGAGRPLFGTTYYVLTITDQFSPPVPN
jgi:hypothetical protein